MTSNTILKRVALAWISFFISCTLCMAQSSTITIRDYGGNLIKNVPLLIYIDNKTIRGKTNYEGQYTFYPNSTKQTRLQISTKLYELIDTIINTCNPQDIRITLHPKTQLLNEVNVVAYKRIAKTDAEKSVYSINMDGLLKNSKADDALLFLPGVEAFGTTYTLIGKNKQARIKIDGLPASGNDLKALRAEDIARVEVRNVSREDNEHFAGEINIIKKRRTEQKIYGDIGVNAGFLHDFWGGDIKINYQSKYWDVSAVATGTSDRQKVENFVDRTFAASGVKESMSLKKSSRVKQEWQRLKASCFPNKKLTLTFSFSHGYDPLNGTDYIHNFDGNYTERCNKEYIEDIYSYLSSAYRLNNLNRLTARAGFYYYKYDNTYPEYLQQDYHSIMREYTGEVVMEHDKVKFLGGSDITYGFKNIFRQNSIPSNGKSCYSLQQLFLTDNISITKNFSAYIVLKWETDNQGKSRYNSFQPTLRLNYNMGKEGNLSANASRTTIRPSIDYTNTDTLFVNDYESTVGNALLHAQRNDAIGISYGRQIKKAYLSLTTQYEHSSDIIDKVYEELGNYNVTTYENVAVCDKISLAFNWSQRLFKNRMNFSVSATGYYQRYSTNAPFETSNLSIPTEGFGYSFNLNTSYLTSKGWRYLLSCQYRARSLNLNSAYYKKPQLYASVTKSFFKNRLDISLAVMNPFVYFGNSKNDYKFRDMTQQIRRRFHNDNISIGVTWNFGKRFRTRKSAGGIENTDIITRGT